MQKTILKGAIIFGVLAFVAFLAILTLGFIMSTAGISCQCFQIFKWSLLVVGIATGLVFWYGCCCKPEDEECPKGIKGIKDKI